MRFPSKRAGFTLVELMVALGLTLFILVLFSSLMVSATGSIGTMKGIAAVDQKVRSAVTTIREDLKGAYVADSGQISISELFKTSADIPSQGYFSIEENDRSLRQGLDAWGNPVDVDTDDVLSLVVAMPGISSDTFFYGRVTHSNNTPGDAMINDPATGQPVINDVGEYLDNVHGAPFTRFDTPNNGLYTSRYAEVVYFLRPSGRQYSPVDGNLRANVIPPIAVPALPATYTLYRRVLLVVENGDQLNLGSTLAPFGVPIPTQYYDRFDISASRQFELLPGGTTWVFDGSPRLHFNTIQDLSRREFRYGMRIFSFTNPAQALNAAASQQEFRAVPMSHVDIGADPVYVHDYNRGGANETWIGRPTLAESGHPNYPFWDDVANTNPVLLADAAPADGVLDAYAIPGAGQHAGEDILLTNVVSFDIKVLEDLSSAPGSLAFLGAAAVNPYQQFDLTTAKGADPVSPAFTASEQRPEFVDLGFAYDFASPFDPALFPGANANCLVAGDYATYNGTFAPFGVDFGFGPDNTFQVGNDDLTTGGRVGPDNQPGRAGIDDDEDSTVDNANEMNWPNSDDSPYYTLNLLGFRGAGQVATVAADAANNPGATNPRNTYDSWSSSAGATGYNPDPTLTATSTSGFRPVPYPRPLKAVQIKLRVLEPSSGIVREVTLIHHFE